MTKHQAAAGWPLSKKTAILLLSLGSGVACAVGQQLFYSSLQGKPTPTASWTIPGFPKSISPQQINTFGGNILDFFTKVFLAIAVATAHDQISWKTIKSRSAELGVIDSLFASRSDVFSALSPLIWWEMPIPSMLLLAFW
jgi:hypothetical protein